MIQHVVCVGHFPLLVADDGELEGRLGDLVDVLDPAAVRLDGVGAQADELDAAFCEFGLELCEGAELGRAHGGVVFWVREEDDPFVADEVVEVDGAGGGVGLEVWGDGAEAETVDGGGLVLCIKSGDLFCFGFFFLGECGV